MKKTFFILALLTSGFLLAANAYGEGADGKLGVWNEERALALGMPLLPIGTIILCESEKVVGFNWANGTYSFSNFKNSKRVFKKVKPKNGCSYIPLWKEKGFISTLKVKGVGSRSICLVNYYFGEEPKKFGGACNESYDLRDDKTWETRISCTGEYETMVPVVQLSPNGIYHLSQIHGNISSKPKGGYKDSQYVEWGHCATISP
jgi:hypothetical protein